MMTYFCIMKTKDMMRLFTALMLLCPALGIASCEDGIFAGPPEGLSGDGADDDCPDAEVTDEELNDDENQGDMESVKNMVLTISGVRYTAVMEDNAAAKAFAAMLPVTLEMEELNGNEKYHYLDAGLPVETVRPDTVHEGDLMLWGTSCVVLFYETFRSSYSYTRLGRIEDTEGLAEAVGRGRVRVEFSL